MVMFLKKTPVAERSYTGVSLVSNIICALCPCVHNTSHVFNSIPWHFPSGRSCVQSLGICQWLGHAFRDKSDEDYVIFFQKSPDNHRQHIK